MTEPMHDISVEGFIESFDRRYPTFILKTLLCDRTTGRNIIWADNEYEALGDGYMGDDEMTVEKITGMNSGVIKPRIAKEQEKQSQRTKSRAEVFTPSWLCNQMNNDLDEAWFGRRDVFNTEIVADDGANTWTPTSDPIEFPKSKGHGWRAYVEATRLEITCGEAPFVCSRYDTVTGDELPVGRRVGFLDRKLRVVTEKTRTRKEWVRRALDALRATYGFEYQGDNLLIARINVFETFAEHLRDHWGSDPEQEELEQAAWIVSWNFWQMNGFTDAVPTNKMDAKAESTLGTFEEPEPEPIQPSLFDLFDDVFPDGTTEETKEEELKETVPLCVIYDWQNGEPFEFATLKGKATSMRKKFYAVIGNPPYQESDGGHEASAAPIYHLFVDQSKVIAERISMVTPSRWFSGGKGLNAYRESMISDHHLKTLVDFPKLYEPFPTVKIRGGVSYFVWDSAYDGPCLVQTMEGGKPASPAIKRYLDEYDVLIRRNEAIPILDKVAKHGEPTLDKRISARKPFGLPTNYHGPSTPGSIANPIRLFESQREGWISRDNISVNSDWIDDWKVLLNRVQGTSAAIETKFMSTPRIAGPGSACTETYLVAGRFNNKEEAQNYVSYLKTRFVRFLISLRKISQDAARGVYAFVPDLDYSHSWTDADLYKRYGISNEEITYIESIVKEMD